MIQEGKNIKIGYVDLFTDVTENGQFSIKIFGDETKSAPVAEITDFSTAYEGFNREDSTRNWKRIQVNANGNSLQLEGEMTEDLLLSDDGLDIYKSDVVIHAMRLWLSQAGKNLGLL